MLNIVTEPTVRIVGRQVVDERALYDFLADHEVAAWETDTNIGAEKLVEVAGRLCYMSFAKPRPGGNKAYTEHILEVGHGSVLEHAVFNLIITGVSRSLTHELVRHRAGMGYSQLSQRFFDESDCSFVVPPLLKWITETTNDPELARQWEETMAGLQAAYKHFSDRFYSHLAHIADPTLRRKAAREAARSVLPNATETKIFVTGNARALRHFIEMRADIGADAEIRRVAIAVLRLLQTEAPNLFGDYEIVTTDGVEHVTTEYRKV